MAAASAGSSTTGCASGRSCLNSLPVPVGTGRSSHMADGARKGGQRPRPHEAPRPGLRWLRCWMCFSSGETLSRWTTELGGKWIRCPNCFGKGWVQEPTPDPSRSPPARPKSQARASSLPPSLLTSADHEVLAGLINRDLPSSRTDETRLNQGGRGIAAPGWPCWSSWGWCWPVPGTSRMPSTGTAHR